MAKAAVKSSSKRKGPGRPRDPERLSFESMQAACEHIGGECTRELLQAAKKAGCPAFRNGRIYAKELEEWLANNDVDASKAETKEQLQIAKLKEEVRRLKMENDFKEGKAVYLDEVQQINARVDSEIIKAMYDAFSDATVQKLGGLNFAERRLLITQSLDSVLAVIHAPVRDSA